MALPALSPIRALIAASDVLSLVLGIAIAAVAYQGYRRNDSRPMLFVSAGFLLAFGVPSLAALAWLALGATQLQAAVVTQAAEVLGFGSVLYGLRFAS